MEWSGVGGRTQGIQQKYVITLKIAVIALFGESEVYNQNCDQDSFVFKYAYMKTETRVIF